MRRRVSATAGLLVGVLEECGDAAAVEALVGG
jgi:hypothetical protein